MILKNGKMKKLLSHKIVVDDAVFYWNIEYNRGGAGCTWLKIKHDREIIFDAALYEPINTDIVRAIIIGMTYGDISSLEDKFVYQEQYWAAAKYKHPDGFFERLKKRIENKVAPLKDFFDREIDYEYDPNNISKHIDTVEELKTGLDDIEDALNYTYTDPDKEENE
jgi:hypothetical protein